MIIYLLLFHCVLDTRLSSMLDRFNFFWFIVILESLDNNCELSSNPSQVLKISIIDIITENDDVLIDLIIDSLTWVHFLHILIPLPLVAWPPHEPPRVVYLLHLTNTKKLCSIIVVFESFHHCINEVFDQQWRSNYLHCTVSKPT